MALEHNGNGTSEQQVIIQNSQSFLTIPTSTNSSRYYEPSGHTMITLSPSNNSTHQDDTNNNEPTMISASSVLNLGQQITPVQSNGFVYEYYKVSDKDGLQWR